ncbi:MAG: hypothetical protein ILNGONEN_01754 [Syntrophorhabdaceae bacterium]|nr:hypothetical protein [Syntrophorhabdaceae bacterium]
MLCGLSIVTSLFAQKRTLTRIYDPIVVTAGKLPALTNDTIKVFTAYRYINNSFEPTPFQIDEVDAKGQFLRESDTIADTNDQVVFMPEGTGDRAPTDKWVEGSSDLRLELEVTDPLTNEKSWIYLFRHIKNAPKATPFVRYSRGAVTGGADTVYATSYLEAHDQTRGWFTDTRIRPPYGDGQDIMDRQKVRVGGRFQIFNVTINEESNLEYRFIRSGGGQVRVLRELGISLTFLGAVIDSTGSFITQYFPYSSVFGAQNVKIPKVDGLTINLIRQSVDLEARASGMKFYNAFNTGGVTIDGAADSPNKTITDPPDGLNWFMRTGEPGTILTLMNIPVIGSTRELYYTDDSGINSDDTGDKKSYGDAGILVRSTSNITGSFSFEFTTYYLGKNQTTATGAQFKQLALSPLQVTAAKQTRTISAVADDSPASPTTFVLGDAQPNPFAPQRGMVQISFNVGATNAAPRLRIFNLLGQEVARFAGADLRRSNAVLWDGRDQLGRLVPAGVYFYQLEAGRQRAVKKLVLIR